MNGHFTPDPGIYESMKCDICSAEMSTTRNCVGARSFAESMAKIKSAYDRFECLCREEEWHKQAAALFEKAKDTPSKRLADLLTEEANEILKNKIATKQWSPFG